ncbi:unnamed protein product [Caenorhabditis angaria]|uniref:Uncharacterized protein n=1 Tax=Caenorhabditis angaria TaxID=860376 RepID=A0A9P1IQY7_9PELO|nr:unnamed protein product [Caenorhabditis angaria]
MRVFKNSSFLLSTNCVRNASEDLKSKVKAHETVCAIQVSRKAGSEVKTTRGFVCNVTSFAVMIDHFLWKTFFSSSPTLITEALLRMDKINQNYQKHEEFHEKHGADGDEISSYTSWILLFSTYIIFFILTMLQFNFNNDGIMY